MTGLASLTDWAHNPGRMQWAGRSEWVQAPQQERSQAVLVAVLEAATRLFSQQGYENTTIAMINAESGISAAAIYRRFSDKSAILRAIVDYWSDAWMNDFERIWDEPDWSAATPEHVIRFHIDLLFSAFRSDPGLLREIDRQCLYDPAVAKIMSGMDRHATERLLRMLIARSGVTEQVLRPVVERVAWIVRVSISGLIPREQAGLWPPFSIQDKGYKEVLVGMALAALLPACTT